MLNKIQSLIDAGNTVVYQCVRYKYAFVIARVITKQDKDLSVGFKSAGHYDDPQRSDSKISIGGPTAESKLFLVQTGDKEYEVFDTEKNYRTGKRVNKPVDFDEQRKLHDSQLVYTYTYDDKIVHRKKEKIVRQKIGLTIRPDLHEAPTAEKILELILWNSKQENVSNLKFESVRPITEVNAEM